jgi:N-acyl-D-amino-acid deacylase
MGKFVAAATLPCLLCPLAFAQDYDLLIRGGKIVDGTGNPWFVADVAVKDRRIAGIGKFDPGAAKRTIDASGLIVTPGFIDIHSHSEIDLRDPKTKFNHNMSAQGITLSVVNQDGRSPLWPLTDQRAVYEKQGIGTHVILMAGHGTARQRVMGKRSREKASDADIRAMQEFVTQGMRDGAWGLSAGLEYDPGRFSQPLELVELTRVIKPYGGVYISHERSEGKDPMWKNASDPAASIDLLQAVQETIAIGRETGVPVVCSHIKAKGASFWGSSHVATRLIREAREQGIEVYADQYPYETSGTDGSTVLVPLWALSKPGSKIAGQLDRDGDSPDAFRNAKENLQARLKDPLVGPQVRLDIEHEIDRRGGARRIVIHEFPDSKYVGKTLEFVAADRKLNPVETVIWIEMNGLDGIAGGARMRGFSIDEADVEHFMQQDYTATCTDGALRIDHPRSWGTFPRKLRRYVYERQTISLPFAVRSMTSLPAQILGLKNRGRIEAGYFADLVLFDPASIQEKSTPFQPRQHPEGIPYVFVDGVAVVEAGKFTNATPGRVLTPAADGWRATLHPPK